MVMLPTDAPEQLVTLGRTAAQKQRQHDIATGRAAWQRVFFTVPGVYATWAARFSEGEKLFLEGWVQA